MIAALRTFVVLRLAASGRLFVASCVGLVLALIGCLVFAASQPEAIAVGRYGMVSPAERALCRELNLLRSCAFEEDRQRILRRAPALARRFDAPMHRLLRIGDSEWIEQAAEYAGAMGVEALAGPLQALALDPGSLTPATRIQALHSAHRLRPFDVADLQRFVEHRSLPVRIAALEICQQRPDAPWPAVVAVLKAGGQGGLQDLDPAGRESLVRAAVAAIPRKLDAALKLELWEMVTLGDAAEAEIGLQALSRTAPDAALAEQIVAHLEQLAGEPLFAALDLLGGWGQPLARSGPVWSIVVNELLSDEVRARALYCLEQTGGFDVGQMRQKLPELPPLVRFFAARCLLSKADGAGFDVLFELLEGDQELRCRQLLAWLTGRSAGSDPRDFLAEREHAIARLAATPMPPPFLRVGRRLPAR